ncbi:MAG: ABC transporter permease [Anaerolineae bacterium]|jgi:peptide/nickel transport system permease protein
MTKFVLRRVVRGLLALVLFQTLLFALIHALPYDFSAFVLATPGWRAFIQREFGLDRPLLKQYVTWLLGFARFDLGASYQHWPTPVSAILLERLPRTLLLFLPAALLAYLLGMWLGKTIAWRRGGGIEVGVTLGAVVSYTSFAPWLGFLAINVFGWHLGWLPYRRLVDHNVWFRAPVSVNWILARMVLTGTMVSLTLLLLRRVTRRIDIGPRRCASRMGGLLIVGIGTWWGWSQSGVGHLAVDVLAHLVLPLGTVVLLSLGETMLTMRTSMLDTLNEDYVTMARAKGLPDRVIRDRHVARNAILPVLTQMALSLPFVLVGSLIIEWVFMWHAMGATIFSAIEYQDIPVLMGILSVVGVLALVAHVVLDVLYAYLDPRVRYQGGK